MVKQNKGQVAAPKGDKTTKHGGVSQTATATATASTAEVRKKTNKSDRPQPKMTFEIIEGVLRHKGLGGLYINTILGAATYLVSLGVEAASLYDAKTGELTAQGDSIIAEAIDSAFKEWLRAILNGDVSTEHTNRQLEWLLSNRAVLEFLLGRFKSRKRGKKDGVLRRRRPNVKGLRAQ